MSLRQVTRCPGCSTRFKVVPDQLRLSQGWVRCGNCNAVFDATLHMEAPSSRMAKRRPEAVTMPQDGQITLPASSAEHPPVAARAEAPSVQPPAPTPPAGAPAASRAVRDADAPAKGSLPASPAAPAPEAGPGSGLAPDRRPPDAAPAFPPEPSPPPAPPAAEAPAAGSEPDSELVVPPDAIRAHAARTPRPAGGPRREPEFAGTTPGSTQAGGSEFKSRRRSKKTRSTEKLPQPRPSRLAAGSSRRSSSGSRRSRRSRSRFADTEFVWPESRLPAQELSFMREAKRQRFWRQPAVRAGLALACVLAGSALVAQVMLQQRDSLAARYPALVPGLQALCRLDGCTLAPRRAIADVAIKHSGFWRMPRSRLYELGLGLENHSAAAVATPAVELTLTDALGMPLLRRVILPEEIDAPAQIAGKGEWSVTAPVAIEGVAGAVAGYRTQVFYP